MATPIRSVTEQLQDLKINNPRSNKYLMKVARCIGMFIHDNGLIKEAQNAIFQYVTERAGQVLWVKKAKRLQSTAALNERISCFLKQVDSYYREGGAVPIKLLEQLNLITSVEALAVVNENTAHMLSE